MIALITFVSPPCVAYCSWLTTVFTRVDLSSSSPAHAGGGGGGLINLCDDDGGDEQEQLKRP